MKMSNKITRRLFWVGVSYSLCLAISPAGAESQLPKCRDFYDKCWAQKINCSVFLDGPNAQKICEERKKVAVRTACAYGVISYEREDHKCQGGAPSE